ncbi:MAG: hypothetical protein JW870_07060 [Candidatus Delongbacteria bacterium]|nr:hypothetical protein [Candidatus Delongbacteria bacterium]
MRLIIKNVCFFAALFLLILKEYWTLFFMNSEPILLPEIVLFSAFLLGVAIFLTKLAKVEIIILCLALMSFIITKNVTFAVISLALFSSKNINTKLIIKIYLLISSVLFLSILVFATLDLMPSISAIDTRIVDGKTLLRYNLGFGSPNGPFLFFMPIFLSTSILYSQKLANTVLYSILIIIVLIINNYTLSRTGFYSSFSFFILLLGFHLFHFERYSLIRFVLKNIIPVLILVSISIALFMNTPAINSILAHRPGYWLLHITGEVYTYNLWGYPWDDEYRRLITEIPLDNSFLSMILSKGAIFSFSVYLFYYKGIQGLLKAKENNYLAAILTTLIFALFENTLFVIGLNFTFFILYHSYLDEKKRKYEQNTQNNPLLLVEQ